MDFFASVEIRKHSAGYHQSCDMLTVARSQSAPVKGRGLRALLKLGVSFAITYENLQKYSLMKIPSTLTPSKIMIHEPMIEILGAKSI